MANTPTRQDIEDAIDQLGEEAGRGKDTQVKFIMQMIQGGYHNVLDLNHNKHGADRDDATVMTERYVKKQTGTSMFDAKAPNQRKAISCARTGVKLGGWPKGGNGEPIANVNKFVSRWVQLRKTPGIKMNDAANSLLRMARAQLKLDRLIDEDAFDGFMLKTPDDDMTAEEIIANAVKKLDKLIDGSASHGTAQCNTANVSSARQHLRMELADIAKARAPSQPVTV